MFKLRTKKKPDKHDKVLWLEFIEYRRNVLFLLCNKKEKQHNACLNVKCKCLFKCKMKTSTL